MKTLTKPERVDPLQLASLVADRNNCYAGEPVRLMIQANTEALPSPLTIRLVLPPELEIKDFTFDNPEIVVSTKTTNVEQTTHLSWTIKVKDNSVSLIEAVVNTAVAPLTTSGNLQVWLEVEDESGQRLTDERLQIQVVGQSRFMTFLPELYYGNDFLNRFLMLFESFSQPIQGQINEMDNYFDIDLTPSAFLPWLASWIGITWDSELDDQRKRQLLHDALQLYQRRGTHLALKDFLQIYTGGTVEIREHRTRNMRLGDRAILGHTIALGRKNLPHTFTLKLKVN